MKTAADGMMRIAILTTKPKNPDKPTAEELNAGINASDVVLSSDLNWSNADSQKFEEKTVRQRGQAEAWGASAYSLGMTFLRHFKALGGGPDVSGEDAAYQAVRTKDSHVWIYVRETDRDSDAPWAAEDEIYLGGEVSSDAPQRPSGEGSIKRRVPFLPVDMYEDIKVVAAGAPAGV